MANRVRDRKTGRHARASGGSDMKKLYVIFAVVAALGVAAVGYSVTSSSGSMATAPVELPEMDGPELVAMAQGFAQGAEGAPVTIVEFGDYQCPGCGSFATLVKPQIEAAYVETDKARFIYYDFPLTGHPHAFLAARAARCAADQDRGWEYHQALFVNQTDWSPTANPASRFVDYAESVGIDEGLFEGCLESDRHAALVTANVQLGHALRVGRTPTVLVSGGGGNYREVEPAFEAIRSAVDSLLAEVGEGATPSTLPDEPGGDAGGGGG